MAKGKNEYVSVEEAASSLGKTPRRIQQLCKEGKIEGAIIKDGEWRLPKSYLSSSPIRKPLPVGISDYIRASTNYCYVDKTLLIKEVIDSAPQALLFTRPRRFGKTLNMDMLRVYFEKREEDTSIYFRDKAIWGCGERYRAEQGKYPVIYLTFKDLKYPTWKETLPAIKRLIAAEFARHGELMKSPALSAFDRQSYAEVIEGAANGDNSAFATSLQTLTKLLYRHHAVKPILIIDEYDAPIEQSHSMGFYEEAIAFFRLFFSAGLKDNESISHAFLTGVLKVTKESLFSGLNNLKSDSILDTQYSQYFGLTKKEVKDLLSSYGKSSKFREACAWYDGYLFGDSRVFNPWSIINYLDDGCRDPKSYWVATASNDLIGESIRNSTPEVMDKLAKLMRGEDIFASIDLDLTYPDIRKNPNSIYSFLLVTGYLTMAEGRKGDEEGLSKIAIPNREVSSVYRKEVLEKFSDVVPIPSSDSIKASLITEDAKGLEQSLESLLKSTISFNDASSEAFYHGLTLGLCAAMGDHYRVYSNRESGDGRFDISMEPRRGNLPGIIIEVKASKKKDEQSLDRLAEEALRQIERKGYGAELASRGIVDIFRLGIAYSGKKVRTASAK